MKFFESFSNLVENIVELFIMEQTVTPNGLIFIKNFEGCKLSPYLDMAGTPTIGWGMTYYPDTGKSVTMTDNPLTQAEADNYFILMVKPYTEGILEAVEGSVELNSNQLCALTDFAYNLGVGAFKQSTLCQHVKDNCVVEADFTEFDHAGGQVVQGLLNRRIAEYQLFITPIVAPIKTMEPTTNVSSDAPTPTVDQTTEQIIKINSVTVNYDQIVNGITQNAGIAVTVKLTPELLAELKSSNEQFVLPGWNIVVE